MRPLYKSALTAGALILLACALTGVILLNAAAREIRSVEARQTDTRVELVRNDLRNQIALMEEAASRMANRAIYLPAFRVGDPLKEVDLAGDLAKYERVSQLSDKCFLLYRGDDVVFKPYVKQFFYVCMNLIGVDDSPDVYGLITSAVDTAVITPEDSERVIFVCPVYFRNVHSRLPQAFLCYISDRQTIARRVADVSGGFDGEWSVTFGGGVIAGEAALPSDTVSDGIDFTLRRRVLVIDGFMALNIGLIAVIGVSFFIISAFISYRKWLPLRRIMDKYPPEAYGIDIRDELEYIDRLIEQGHRQQKAMRASIERQRAIIAHQLLAAMLRGEKTDASVVEDIFPYESFALICVSFPEPPENAERLIGDIEALSDEDIVFCCASQPGTAHLVCLACFHSAPRLKEARDLVSACVETDCADYTMGLSAVRDMPEDIPAALVDALDESPAGEAEESGEALDDSLIAKIVSSVRSGDRQNANAYLKRYVATICAAGHISGMLLSELMCRLMRVGREQNCPVDEAHCRLIADMGDRESVYAAVSALVGDMCDAVASRRNRKHSDQFDAILAYIDEHALDYDLDQDKVARLFGVSPSSLYRMFKTILGDSYKRYVTDIRIRKACECLDEGLSVQEVCGAVGYTNVSYFIKAFKSVTGYTPNGYKSRQRDGAPLGESDE